MSVSWGVDKRQVRRFWISHVEVRILPPQPDSSSEGEAAVLESEIKNSEELLNLAVPASE